MKVNIGKGIEMDVSLGPLGFTSELTDVAQHVVYIGLRNILMDAHASHTRDADGSDFIAKSEEAANDKLQALYNGEVRMAGTRSSDPVATQMRSLAMAHARKALRASRKAKDISSKEVTAEANRLLERNRDALRKVAEKMVKAAAALEVDVQI